MSMSVLQTDGTLALISYELNDSKISYLANVFSPKLFTDRYGSFYGYNCHSWSKYYLSKHAVIAVGGKSSETTNLKALNRLKMS